MTELMHYKHIYEVHDDGQEYVFSLLCDYEEVVVERGALTISEFLKGWNIIPMKAFNELQKGDVVYDQYGEKYLVDTEHATFNYRKCEDILQISAHHCTDDDENSANSRKPFFSGELYYTPYHHDWIKFKPKKIEGDKICPILIINQVQHQS